MISKEKLDSLAQIVKGLEDATEKLEQAKKEKNSQNFEQAKKAIIELHQNMEKELKNEKRI